MKETPQRPSFDRHAWLVLIAALLLLLSSAAQLIYRFTLPTDGWSVYSTEAVQSSLFYDLNLVGSPSELVQNDELLAVDGRSLQGTASSYLAPPPGWQAGSSVATTVRRGDKQLSLAVPVVHWTAAAFWRLNAGQLSQVLSTSAYS